MADELSLEVQERLLRYRFARADVWYTRVGGAGCLCFRVQLRPTPTSDRYTVTFAYAMGDLPRVWVDSPKPVQEAHGQRTPHLNYDGTLCLYDSTNGEWTGADALAYTIVPWTQRWLFHYEHWLVFGEWRGDAPTRLVPEAELTGAQAEVSS